MFQDAAAQSGDSAGVHLDGSAATLAPRQLRLAPTREQTVSHSSTEYE